MAARAPKKVVILCGGKGTRLKEETEQRPKPMLEIGGRPILWHIMKSYSHHGFHDFVLALGYKGEHIKNYFLNYDVVAHDLTVRLGPKGGVDVHRRRDSDPWTITLVDTGADAMTGARVKRVEKYLEGEPFHLTYGDGVSDVDLQALAKFHQKHGRVGTVTGVHPLARFGELELDGTRVRRFSEKPQVTNSFINGGFFVLQPEFFDYVLDDDGCVLEHEPLRGLAEDGQLESFVHPGFWHCMDTLRDYQRLNELWESPNPPWKVWR